MKKIIDGNNFKWDVFHDYTKEFDPAGHYAIDHAWKSSTRLVNDTSQGFVNWGDKWNINTRVPEEGVEVSDKDNKSFDRWFENTVGTVAALYGASEGMGASGGESGGSAGAAGGGEAAPNAIGYGTEGMNGYTMPGSGGFSAGDFSPAVGTSTTSGWNWADGVKSGGQTMSNMGKAQEPDDEEVKESDVQFAQSDLKSDPYAYSSKRLKTGPRVNMKSIMARGAAGADPIDQNGVHMASIQALTKRLVAAKARLAQLKGKHA